MRRKSEIKRFSHMVGVVCTKGMYDSVIALADSEDESISAYCRMIFDQWIKSHPLSGRESTARQAQ